jgi:hypothetical protein
MAQHLIGVVNRAIGYALAGIVSAAVAHEQKRTEMLFGVAIGAISALMAVICPIIERWADSLAVRRLGMFGALLFPSRTGRALARAVRRADQLAAQPKPSQVQPLRKARPRDAMTTVRPSNWAACAYRVRSSQSTHSTGRLAR